MGVDISCDRYQSHGFGIYEKLNFGGGIHMLTYLHTYTEETTNIPNKQNNLTNKVQKHVLTRLLEQNNSLRVHV